MIFESLSTNEFNAVVGPKDLNSSNVWDLTTPVLSKCFVDPFYPTTGSLTWNELASDIADGNYERTSARDCFSSFFQGISATENSNSFSLGIKAVVALADNLTVADGGNISILSTDLNKLYVDTFSLWAIPFFNQSAGNDSSIECLDASDIHYSTVNDDDNVGDKFVIGECLAIKTDESCELLYSPPICIAISLAAAVKVMVMLFTIAYRG